MVTPGHPILYITSVLKVWMNISQPSGQLASWSRTMTGTRTPAIYLFIILSNKNPIGLILSFISCSDKMFPAFGFGAQIPPSWQVNEITSAVVAVTNSQKPQFTKDCFFPGVSWISSQLQSRKSILCWYVTISVFNPLHLTGNDVYKQEVVFLFL